MSEERTAYEGKLLLVREDITKLSVDAIVNAANVSLLGGGGVDGAIHRAAGRELLVECRSLGGCETGDVKATAGYKLPAKWVLHAVGPVWQGGAHGESALLARCYSRAMDLAAELGARSVAFPAISCGVYSFPIESAVQIALREVTDGLARNPAISKVVLACFELPVLRAYQSAWDGLRSE